MKGEAQAFAIEAKAKAEAEQMAKKADAWKEYQEAAMVDMMLETLPKVCIHVFCLCFMFALIVLRVVPSEELVSAKLTLR